MSLVIRSQIEATISLLATRLQEGEILLNRELKAEDGIGLATTNEFLRREIITVERLLTQWTQLMASMRQGDRLAEEGVFTAFEPSGRSPLSWLAHGRELTTRMDLKLDLLKGLGKAPPSVTGPIQLPTLVLPEFDGRQESWYSFFEAFDQAVHSNNALSGTQKLTYLYGRLKGPARAMAEGYAFTEANYQIVLDKLKARYGNTYRQASDLQAQLYRLQKANSSATSLRSLYEGVDEVCRKLAGLGVDTSENPFVATAIKEKLPPPTLAYLLDKEMDGVEPWTSQEWLESLSKVVKVQEIAHTSSENPTKREPYGPPKHPGHGQPQRRAFPIQGTNSTGEFKGPKGNTKRECSLCKAQGHPPSKCPQFNTPEKRKDRLLQQKRCLLCAREGHFAKECPMQKGCEHCGGKHHFLICYKRTGSQPASGGNSQKISPKQGIGNQNRSGFQNTPVQTSSQRGPPSQSLAITGNGQAMTFPALNQVNKVPAYFMMREIPIMCPRDSARTLCVLTFLDLGSDTNFVTTQMVREAGLKKVANDRLTVSGFVGNGEINLHRFTSPRYSVMLRREDGGWEEIIANRTDRITPSFPYLAPQEASLTWAEKSSNSFSPKTDEPHILISIRDFWRFVLGKEEVGPRLFRISTVFGTFFCGEHPPELSQQISRAMPVIRANHGPPGPDELVRQLWSLETLGIMDSPEQDDNQKAVQLFNESIRRDNEGRYEVKWPWRSSSPDLPDNYSMAYSRLAMLSPKLLGNPALRERYDDVIRDQLSRGIIEPAERTGAFEHFFAS